MALFGPSLAPCPYCYNKIDPKRAMFRCTGRQAAGRVPCQKREDDVRRDALGDATPVYGSFTPAASRLPGARAAVRCPSCDGITSIRVCPGCHSVLPANFTAESPMFGIVGVRGSGKTVMLSVLTQELTSTVARRFKASIDSVGTSKLLEDLAQLRRGYDSESRALPEQTARAGKSTAVPAVFEWQISRERLGGSQKTLSTILSFYDSSGEDLASLDRTREQHYLAAADGLILLLDPFGFPENRTTAISRGVSTDALVDEPRSVLRNVTEMLREAEQVRNGKKIKRPLAIVLAKIDAFFDEVGPDHTVRSPSITGPYFSEKESLDLHNHAAALVSQWGGDDVLAMLELNYTTYRFFVASALGVEPDYRTARVNAKGVLPHRVAEPLLWHMARRGFLPTEG